MKRGGCHKRPAALSAGMLQRDAVLQTRSVSGPSKVSGSSHPHRGLTEQGPGRRRSPGLRAEAGCCSAPSVPGGSIWQGQLSLPMGEVRVGHLGTRSPSVKVVRGGTQVCIWEGTPLQREPDVGSEPWPA